MNERGMLCCGAIDSVFLAMCCIESNGAAKYVGSSKVLVI